MALYAAVFSSCVGRVCLQYFVNEMLSYLRVACFALYVNLFKIVARDRVLCDLYCKEGDLGI